MAKFGVGQEVFQGPSHSSLMHSLVVRGVSVTVKPPVGLGWGSCKNRGLFHREAPMRTKKALLDTIHYSKFLFPSPEFLDFVYLPNSHIRCCSFVLLHLERLLGALNPPAVDFYSLSSCSLARSCSHPFAFPNPGSRAGGQQEFHPSAAGSCSVDFVLGFLSLPLSEQYRNVQCWE